MLAKALSKRQEVWLATMQDRIKATSRLLESVRVIKMLGSEERIGKAISALRAVEIRSARPFRNFLTAAVFCCTSLFAKQTSSLSVC